MSESSLTMDNAEEEFNAEFMTSHRARLKKNRKLDSVLEGKHKARSGKCVGIPTENMGSEIIEDSTPPHKYNEIPEQIWYLICQQIEPEDTGRFALICKHTAKIVASRQFWKGMYRKYCRKAVNSELSSYHTYSQSQKETEAVESLRHITIRSLSVCWPELYHRMTFPYHLDFLVGQTLLLSNYHKSPSRFSIHMKFSRNYVGCKINGKTNTKQNLTTGEDVPVDDWEELLLTNDDNNEFRRNALSACSNFINPHEGQSLFIIYFQYFSAGAYQEALYKNEYKNCILHSYRTILNQNMTYYSLELTFRTSDDNHVTVTLDDFNIWRIYPWWHSHFLLEETRGFLSNMQTNSFEL